MFCENSSRLCVLTFSMYLLENLNHRHSLRLFSVGQCCCEGLVVTKEREEMKGKIRLYMKNENVSFESHRSPRVAADRLPGARDTQLSVGRKRQDKQYASWFSALEFNDRRFGLTAEVLHFQVLRAGLLAGERVVEHDFRLCLYPLVELPHGHVAEAPHVLAHLVVRLQLQTPLRRRGRKRALVSIQFRETLP